jgi:hypothetical protein
MAREIDIVCAAAARGCAVVDKASHALWTPEELAAAARAGCYPDEDSPGPGDGFLAVSGLYPGCLQQGGQAADLAHYRLLGETEHFAVFAAPGMALSGAPKGRDNRAQGNALGTGR